MNGVLARAGATIYKHLKEDVKVAGDSVLMVIVASINLFASWHLVNILPKEYISETTFWWVSRQSYGSQMLFIAIIITMIIVAFITKKDAKEYDRPLLLLALTLMFIDGFMIYQWGIKYNLSFF